MGVKKNGMSSITKHFFLKVLSFYQKYLSVLSYGSCRYYPTCSEYLKWQFLYNKNPLIAIYAAIIRILKCNPFFVGGIDYPKISNQIMIKNLVFHKQKKINIVFWFVPSKNEQLYIIKAFSRQ